MLIAREKRARVVFHEWKGFGAQKNYALSLAHGEWVFSIDADERVTPELAAEIRRKIADAPRGHFKVPIANLIGGRWVRHGWGAYNGVSATPRLSARGAKHWGDQLVHPHPLAEDDHLGLAVFEHVG